MGASPFLFAFVVTLGLLGLALLTFIAVRVDAVARELLAARSRGGSCPAPEPEPAPSLPDPPALPPPATPCPDCEVDPHKIWNRQRDRRGVDLTTEEPVNPVFLLLPPSPPS